jgi:hypothetical protein
VSDVRSPLVSPKAAAILGGISAALGIGSTMLPAMWGTGALIGSGILAFAAGLGLPQLRIAAGRPLVPLTLAVPLGTLAGFLMTLAAAMPESTARAGLILVAAILAFVAGKAIDAPAPAAPVPAPVPLPETPEEALPVLPEGTVGDVAEATLKGALARMPVGAR